MHPITSLTDYEKNRIAGDTELFSPRNQEQAEEEAEKKAEVPWTAPTNV